MFKIRQGSLEYMKIMTYFSDSIKKLEYDPQERYVKIWCEKGFDKEKIDKFVEKTVPFGVEVVIYYF